MEGLLAQAIARQNELALVFVVDGQPKHAAQLLHAVGAHFLIEVDNNFRIGLGVEAMAALFQFRAQFRKVVDLAVVNDPGAAVLVENGLVPARQIDDAETPHTQPGAVRDVDAFLVRSAMDDRVAHLAHESFGDVALPRRAHYSGDTTHILISILPNGPVRNSTWPPTTACPQPA